MGVSSFTNTSKDSFLIAQFAALGSHVDGLFNSGAQRVNAYILLAGLIFAGLQFIQDGYYKLAFLAVSSAFVAVVGIWIYIATIHINIRAIQYYRIMNRIRGCFAENDEDIRLMLEPLPLSADALQWDTSVFDPGLILIKAIISTSIASIVGCVILYYNLFSKILHTSLLSGTKSNLENFLILNLQNMKDQILMYIIYLQSDYFIFKIVILVINEIINNVTVYIKLLFSIISWHDLIIIMSNHLLSLTLLTSFLFFIISWIILSWYRKHLLKRKILYVRLDYSYR